MSMTQALMVLEVLIAALVLLFLLFNIFQALRQLGYLLATLGILTLILIFFHQWPIGWLIPASQEIIMAGVIFIVGYLGGKNKTPAKK